MNRRTLITGLVSLLAAPAIIRTPGLLMPIRPLDPLLVGVKFGIKEWLPPDAWRDTVFVKWLIIGVDPYNGPVMEEVTAGLNSELIRTSGRFRQITSIELA
jgi:hypothetical protein